MIQIYLLDNSLIFILVSFSNSGIRFIIKLRIIRVICWNLRFIYGLKSSLHWLIASKLRFTGFVLKLMIKITIRLKCEIKLFYF